MISTGIILDIAIVFGIMITLAFLLLYRRFAKLRQRLTAVGKELDRALRCLNGTECRQGDHGFAANLEEAAIKTKLQQYGAAKQSNKDETGGIPERYRHVSTLANHGLDKDAISAILRIPKGEAEQLLKLFNLTSQCA